ncbi:MAG TPA: DUF3499 domain-containing protein [Candidatus Nanopelagicaceae bacterium]
MSPSSRLGRGCSRSGCRRKALMTLTYVYAESVAVVGPLATFAEPHAYDLCEFHGNRLTVPNGWNVIRQERDASESGPTDDDLMAIADAVREVAKSPVESGKVQSAQNPELGRRGHLRAVPS